MRFLVSLGNSTQYLHRGAGVERPDIMFKPHKCKLMSIRWKRYSDLPMVESHEGSGMSEETNGLKWSHSTNPSCPLEIIWPQQRQLFLFVSIGVEGKTNLNFDAGAWNFFEAGPHVAVYGVSHGDKARFRFIVHLEVP